MLAHTSRDTCRVCGSSDMSHVFALGNHYINDFVEPGKAYEGVKCPIEMVKCNKCTLYQNPHTAPQELLYSRHYWYKSGTTETMRAALLGVAYCAINEAKLEHGDTVLDIGSNDGTLLKGFSNKFRRVGVEPATNMTQYYDGSSIDLINDFWSAEVYASKQHSAPKVITALGMFYDLEDPNEFIAGVRAVLHRDGVFIAQLMCLANMINVCDLGNMAHEHLEFYTLVSLNYLLTRHGLRIYKIETNTVNGESYRLYICHMNSMHQAHESVVRYFRAEEMIDCAAGDFFYKVEQNKEELQQFFMTAKNREDKVFVYGASTKGNTILQWLELNENYIQLAAEKDKEKWGKVTAGSNIPICSEEFARELVPSYFFVLPYAFIREFTAREMNQEWRHRGGRFIVPFPKVSFV